METKVISSFFINSAGIQLKGNFAINLSEYEIKNVCFFLNICDE